MGEEGRWGEVKEERERVKERGRGGEGWKRR